MKTYIIREDKLRELLHSQMTLDALESAGVDNWAWYGEHWNAYFEIGDFGPERDAGGIESDIDDLIREEIDFLMSKQVQYQAPEFDILALFKKKIIKLSPRLETTEEVVWKDEKYIYALESDGSFNKYEWRGFVETLTPDQMQKIMIEFYMRNKGGSNG